MKTTKHQRLKVVKKPVKKVAAKKAATKKENKKTMCLLMQINGGKPTLIGKGFKGKLILNLESYVNGESEKNTITLTDKENNTVKFVAQLI